MAFKDLFKPKKEETSKKSSEEVKQEVDKDQEEQQLVDKVLKMYKDSYNSKGKLHKTWERCYKAYTGELFEKNRPDYRSNEVSNYVFSTIETIKPIMLNDSPKTTVIPRQGSFYEKAKVIQGVMDNEWVRSRMFSKLHSANHLNLIYGTSIAGVFWNANSRNGLGDVEPVIISPFNFFPEPSATNIENAEYVIYAVNKKVSEVCKVYPDKAEKLKKQGSQEVDEYINFGKKVESNGRDNILYIECYLKDYSDEITTEVEKDDKGNDVKYQITKKKYPNGRRIIVAGDVLLDDGENPYNDGQFPFEVMTCYPQHGSFWGIGEVEMLISPQEHANRIMNAIIENAELNGNPWTVLDKNCGIEQNSLSNAPGLVLRKNPGSKVERVAPPPIPGYVGDTVAVLKKDMEQISGVYDVVRGEKPGSITAASAIQALNEQAQGRVKLKVQNLEHFIGMFGAMWLRRIQQFWVTKRVVRVVGQPMTDDVLTNQVIQMDNGSSMHFLDISKDDIDGDYDIEVFAGSTMQTNKSAIAQTIIQLAQTMGEDGLPMLDRKTVLENVISTVGQINVSEVIQHFDNIKQQQAQEQQAMAQSQQEAQMMAQEQEAMQVQQEQAMKEQEFNMNMQEKQMDMDMKLQDHQLKQEQSIMKMQEQQIKQEVQQNSLSGNENPLQKESNDVQSNGEVNQIQQIVDKLLEMSPEEYSAFLMENPQIAELVENLIQEAGMEG